MYINRDTVVNKYSLRQNFEIYEEDSEKIR